MTDKKAKIISNEIVESDILEMKIEVEKGLEIKAGMFINVGVPGGDLLLKRPFCIYDYNNGILSFRYQILGEGTLRLSKLEKGEVLVTYPLGKGFDTKNYKKIAIVGGGIGIFPLHLLKNENVEIYSFLGFRNAKYASLSKDFEKFSKQLFLATDDGSVGTKGFITNILNEKIKELNVDAVFACGPKIMLKSLKSLNLELPVFVSLEERMGCGVGACLVCICKTDNNGEKNNKRVCYDGPVFNLNEVEL